MTAKRLIAAILFQVLISLTIRVTGIAALSSQYSTCKVAPTSTTSYRKSQLALKLREREKKCDLSNNRKRKCEICPEPEIDRSEAAFAMLGTLWSTGVIPANAISSLVDSMKDSNSAAIG